MSANMSKMVKTEVVKPEIQCKKHALNYALNSVRDSRGLRIDPRTGERFINTTRARVLTGYSQGRLWQIAHEGLVRFRRDRCRLWYFENDILDYIKFRR